MPSPQFDPPEISRAQWAVMGEAEPIIETLAVEPFYKNGYLLACPETRHGIYIDPGDEAPEMLERIEKLKVELIAVVATHAHMDHICGISAVKKRWDVPIYVHPDDVRLYEQLPAQARFFGLNYDPAPPADRFLAEGEPLRVGRLSIEVFHTPGHAPGHVCLQVGRHIFCGDTVFAGSIGRTDLLGGSIELLLESIRATFLPRGDEMILHPGHGPQTTIGQERRSNPFLATRAG